MKKEEILRCTCGAEIPRNKTNVINGYEFRIQGKCPACGKVKEFDLSSDTDGFSNYK